jgi:hypothetical protein
METTMTVPVTYTSNNTGDYSRVWIDDSTNTYVIDATTYSNYPVYSSSPEVFLPLSEDDKLKEGELVKMKEPKKYRYKKERLFMVKTVLFDMVNGYEKGWCFLQQVGRNKFLVGPMQDFEKVM